ncbi:hypothetical protein C8R46DRAFT_879917 [Mycena filopes]|nr:hypothetical protein C8R46DRAFT_879917 [Mycena filopes]
MVDGVVKRTKGVLLGSAKRYGVYEAEGVGQVLALECLRQERDEDIGGIIPLGVDNTSAIRATTSAKAGVGSYIWDAFQMRLTMARQQHPEFRLRVDWTPGHVDIPGNEAADEAARRAAQTGSFGGTPRVLTDLPYSKSALALTHMRLLQTSAKKTFKRSPRYARIKDVDNSAPSSKFRKLTAPLPRKHASLLFQLRSHHAPLAKHLFRLKKVPSPICQCCGACEETIDHFLHHCSAHAHARRLLRQTNRHAAFTNHLLTDPKLLPDFFQFVQRTGRFHAVYGDFKELERPDDQ